MQTTEQFLGAWSTYMFYGILSSIGLGILIFLYYELRVLKIRDYKEKYDFVNHYEIRYFWYAIVAMIISAGFAINTLGDDLILESGNRWFFVRIFISACFIVVGYFLFYSLIRIYYPRKLARRLQHLRTAPRLSPDGNLMRRLSEEEEDVHMEPSMIKEEEVQIVDYDVWIDEKTGYKKIEKYIIHEQSAECPECSYYTFVVAREEMGKSPTEAESGYVIEHLECTYCGYKERREVEVAKLSTNVAT